MEARILQVCGFSYPPRREREVSPMRLPAERCESATLLESAMCGRSDAWVTRSAAAEARDLYRMVRHGDCTIASIRELICVPPEIQAVFLAYVRTYPEDAGRIRRVLRFREEVGRAFENLVAPSMSPPASGEVGICSCAEASAA